jgi:hypothetical protein
MRVGASTDQQAVPRMRERLRMHEATAVQAPSGAPQSSSDAAFAPVSERAFPEAKVASAASRLPSPPLPRTPGGARQ